jgi:hypothetical protein
MGNKLEETLCCTISITILIILIVPIIIPIGLEYIRSVSDGVQKMIIASENAYREATLRVVDHVSADVEFYVDFGADDRRREVIEDLVIKINSYSKHIRNSLISDEFIALVSTEVKNKLNKKFGLRI